MADRVRLPEATCALFGCAVEVDHFHTIDAVGRVWTSPVEGIDVTLPDYEAHGVEDASSHPLQANLVHREHVLKIQSDAFEDIVARRKNFEVRLNDRLYQRGDALKLLRYEGAFHPYRNSVLYARIGYIHTGLGMQSTPTSAYVVLGLMCIAGPFNDERAKP